MTFSSYRNYGKTDKCCLTDKAATTKLKNVPSHNTRHNSKQTQGGNVTNTQPPTMSGIFLPATHGDSTELSGVARNKKPSCGNTCSVTLCALRGSRLLLGSQHSKQTQENNAMQTLQSTARGASVPLAKGLPPHNTILSCDVLHQSLHQAKTDLHRKGRGNAYARLLNQFHALILPVFAAETGGNISEMSRLLGLHRETVRDYLSRLDQTTGQGGAQ